MSTPWARIRTEWLKGGTTYKKLAEKYKLSEKTIRNRAYKEAWGKEKGQIEDEARTKTRARIVHVREEQLFKLAQANGNIIDALLAITTQAEGTDPYRRMFDKTGSVRNVESLTKAIQLAVQNQRDLYRLPDMDMELRKKEAAQRKRDNKAKMQLEREKWELEKQKAQNEQQAEQEVWELQAPEGEELDG